MELEVLDGFQLLQGRFELSMAQIEALGSQGMDDAIICDLFVNSRFRMSDVAYLANTTAESVIQTLLGRGIVKDRRSKPRPTDNGN